MTFVIYPMKVLVLPLWNHLQLPFLVTVISDGNILVSSHIKSVLGLVVILYKY